MNTPVTTSHLASLSGAGRLAAQDRLEETDAFIAAANDDDLELALRLVAWNRRDLGQFLKTRAPRC